jgi:hypothetical protein
MIHADYGNLLGENVNNGGKRNLKLDRSKEVGVGNKRKETMYRSAYIDIVTRTQN